MYLIEQLIRETTLLKKEHETLTQVKLQEVFKTRISNLEMITLLKFQALIFITCIMVEDLKS